MLGLLLATTVVFERVEPVEVRTGVMRLRVVEAPLLEVPEELAEDLPSARWRETRFTRLYAIEFDLESRKRDRSQLEDRGALRIAVRTSADDLVALDERLRALLTSLGADAFAAPMAGIREGTPAFLDLASISEESSWLCAVRGARTSNGSATAYWRQTEKGPDGRTAVTGTSSASSGVPDLTRRVCDELRLAAQVAAAEEIRTLPSPRELHELRLEMEAVDTLPPTIRREDLTPLPPGVKLSRKRTPGAVGGASRSRDDTSASYIEREVEWSVLTAPASLSPDLLARGAHVSRWVLRKRERRLGVSPRDEERTIAVRTVAFVPVEPARMAEESPPASFPVELNDELLQEDVGHELEAASAVDGPTLESALRGGAGMGPQWLRSDGWMMIVCREDGTAWFGFPPTGARNTVTNPALICAAMERMLPAP